MGRKADGLTSANRSDTELSTPRKAVRFVSIGEDEEGLRSPREFCSAIAPTKETLLVFWAKLWPTYVSVDVIGYLKLANSP